MPLSSRTMWHPQSTAKHFQGWPYQDFARRKAEAHPLEGDKMRDYSYLGHDRRHRSTTLCGARPLIIVCETSMYTPVSWGCSWEATDLHKLLPDLPAQPIQALHAREASTCADARARPAAGLFTKEKALPYGGALCPITIPSRSEGKYVP
eukprot:1136949-Pelagomonas_calceolata.AAC.2